MGCCKGKPKDEAVCFFDADGVTWIYKLENDQLVLDKDGVVCGPLSDADVHWKIIPVTQHRALKELVAVAEAAKMLGSCPQCPDCSKPMVWNDDAQQNYDLEWTCKNLSSFGSESGKMGASRWFCKTCQNDDCNKCQPKQVFNALPQEKIDPLLLQVNPATDIEDGDHDDILVLVRVRTPDAAERAPSCFCCVLDVSASMCTEAKIVGSSGSIESHGLTLLDVAKHGVRTIVNILTEKDKLAIVTFNQKASILLGATVMDEAGKKMAESCLNTARADGGTDIWEGLIAGLEILRPLTRDRICHLMLLSDGESSYRDEILPNLESHKRHHGQFRGTINTFGFGYKIDSELLVDLAAQGDGSYGFIPDPSFIGTAFVNMISNLLTTCARGVRILVEPLEGCTILEVLGGHEVAVDTDSNALTVRLGMLQYQQTRDVVLRMRIKEGGPYLRVSGQYEPLNPLGIPLVPFGIVQGSPKGSKEVAPQFVRCKVVGALNQALSMGVFNKTNSMVSMHSTDNFKRFHSVASDGSSLSASSGGSSPSTSASTMVQSPSLLARLSKKLFGNRTDEQLAVSKKQSWQILSSKRIDRSEALRIAKQAVDDLRHEISAEISNDDPLIKAICKDITGQMAEAVSCTEYFVKWGRHYLPSLMFAHKLQQCHNFKDPGVQLYGGALFNELRDKADDIFNQLPPLEPSTRRWIQQNSNSSSDLGHASSTLNHNGPISMASYNDRFAG